MQYNMKFEDGETHKGLELNELGKVLEAHVSNIISEDPLDADTIRLVVERQVESTDDAFLKES